MNERTVILNLTSLATGGAGQYTMDFHKSLLSKGYLSYVIVRGTRCIYPDGTEHPIILRHKCRWNKIRRYCFRKLLELTHFNYKKYSFFNPCERFTCFDARDIATALPKKPDVIFIHWVSDFANARFIRDLEHLTGARVIFKLIDHALYSGGCHYQMDCNGYQYGCHNCPATKSKIVQWCIAQNYSFKKSYLPKDAIINVNDADIQKLALSELLNDFRRVTVEPTMDEAKFCPIEDRSAIRKHWDIPKGKKIVFFGATYLDEPRKGMQVLLNAIPQVKNKNIMYIVAGNANGLQLPQNTIYLGYLDEEKIIQAYQVADVFVCPTLADAGPMMVRQALMCGTPVVAFPVGISSVFVKTGETGYLAQYGNSSDLARGIDMICGMNYKEYENISRNCRQLAILKYSNRAQGATVDELIKHLYENGEL